MDSRDIKQIRAAIESHRGITGATDQQIMALWTRLPHELQTQYLYDLGILPQAPGKSTEPENMVPWSDAPAAKSRIVWDDVGMAQ